MQSLFYVNTGLRKAEYQMVGSIATRDNIGASVILKIVQIRTSRQYWAKSKKNIKQHSRVERVRTIDY